MKNSAERLNQSKGKGLKALMDNMKIETASAEQDDSTGMIIDDYTALKLAKMLLKMKERFIDTPEGQKKYAEWHLKEYGCLPD